jgi:hypothetical protein
MFACRLSEREYEALEDLLELSRQVSNEHDRSKLFREIILELKNRFERDGLHHLKYIQPKDEPLVNF